MMIMPGNNRGAYWGYLCAKYPNKMGSLLSPGSCKEPVPFAPYALDNGAFVKFDPQAFLALIGNARRAFKAPLWLAVPDRVGDRETTLALWSEWEPRLRGNRWPLAFVVQDGMTPRDVPESADLIFVGGSTEWKWRHLQTWTKNFKRVHVGRVNTERHLWAAHDAGAESCDSTGWFRSVQEKLPMLLRYLQNDRNTQPTLL